MKKEAEIVPRKLWKLDATNKNPEKHNNQPEFLDSFRRMVVNLTAGADDVLGLRIFGVCEGKYSNRCWLGPMLFAKMFVDFCLSKINWMMHLKSQSSVGSDKLVNNF